MKKTLKFRRITLDDFEKFFLLDSPGYFIARDAVKAGEIGNALDTVEALCLLNQLYESELLNRLIVELAPLGKLDEYIEKRGTDAGGDFIVEALGKARALQLLQEVTVEVKRLAKVGTGENEKAAR